MDDKRVTFVTTVETGIINFILKCKIVVTYRYRETYFLYLQRKKNPNILFKNRCLNEYTLLFWHFELKIPAVNCRQFLCNVLGNK